MSKKKHSVLGMAALAAAGAGAAVLANKSREEKQIIEAHVDPNYRNTERGKNEKNSKGIYYTNGNYEAFARPEKPEGVDDKHAYLVGSGLASLAAACFLVRDAQMPGDHIHILEAILAEERGMADWLLHHQSAVVAEFLLRAERSGVEVGL